LIDDRDIWHALNNVVPLGPDHDKASGSVDLRNIRALLNMI